MDDATHPLRAGWDADRVTARLGAPDRKQVLQNSFRPPGADEGRSAYGEARRRWEAVTPGEVWLYRKARLSVRFSKAGRVLDWSAMSEDRPGAGPVDVDPSPPPDRA
jgi:hypothetical protein